MEIVKRLVIALLLTIVVPHIASAQQELFYKKNLANIKVDQLSDEQVLRFRREIESSSMSEKEIASYLRSKGLSKAEEAKLRKRLGGKTTSQGSMADMENFDLMGEYLRMRDSLELLIGDTSAMKRGYAKTRIVSDSIIFGSELFMNAKMSFTPNLKLATPVNYQVGPGDVLSVTLFGFQEGNYELEVTPEGKLNVPYGGLISVGGLNIGQVTKKIEQALAKSGFSSLRNGDTQLSVTLSDYRSIPVTVIGARSSGNFMMPAVATVFHALYQAGGPTSRGTYREIELIRKGKVIQKIDLYKFLVSGDMGQNIGLQENDVINIPVYESRIMLKGEVKRPGLFELLANETLEDLLKFAGGFTDIAYKNQLHIEQVGDNEFVTKDVEQAAFAQFKPKTGDIIEVGSILNRFSKRVAAAGAVMRPGYYGWQEGMMLKDLLKLTQGVKENALMTRGLIFRSRKDHTREYLRFNVDEAVNGSYNMALEDGDSLVIGDRSLFFPEDKVNVIGEVINPGEYQFGQNMTLGDALLLAGGLKKTAIPNRVEIARRVDNSGNMEVAKAIEGKTDLELIIKADEIVLQPQDVVLVRPNPAYQEQKLVEIIGEVNYPGPYVIVRKEEKISDVVQRAGGPTNQADLRAVFLIRKKPNTLYLKVQNQAEEEEMDFMSSSKKTNQNKTNTGKSGLDAYLSNMETDSMVLDTIVIELNKIMLRNGNKYDLVLRDGDILHLPEKENTVAVKGAVNSTLVINYNGSKLRSYLRDAGGTSKNADRRRIYVVEPSGKSRATVSFLWMRKFPKVIPGSTVMVPPRQVEDEVARDPARTAATASIIASTTGLVFLIASLLR